MKRIFLLFFMSLIFLVEMQAQSPTITWDGTGKIGTVTNATPGSLYDLINGAGKLTTCTGLVISGNLDARDFQTMKASMPAITSIDLANVTIKEYTGTKGTQGTYSYSYYAANLLPHGAFYLKSLITSLVLPTNITEIGESAMRMTGLTTVTIPGQVNTFGNWALDGASKLTTVNFETNIVLKTLGVCLFQNCTKLTAVNNLPESLNLIDVYVFAGCSSLASITLPSAITTFSGAAFKGCTQLVSVNMPTSLKAIASYTFENCKILPNLTLPKSFLNLAQNAFLGCDSLVVDVAVDNLFFTASDSILYNKAQTNIVYCSPKVKGNVVVADNVTAINGGAFSDCRAVTGIQFGTLSTLYSIGDYAFKNCTGLSDVYLPASLSDLSGSAFNGSSANLIFTDGFVNKDGIVYTADMKTLVMCNSTKKGNVFIPEGVTTIKEKAFFNCDSITSVYMPNTITEIGIQAFYDCGQLQKVILSDKLVVLPEQCFFSCIKLSDIDIPESVTSIESAVFYNCTNLMYVSLHKGLVSIGISAFYHTRILSISLPYTVKSIEDNAFQSCYTLSSVDIPVQVEKIGKGIFSVPVIINVHWMTPPDLSTTLDAFGSPVLTQGKLVVPVGTLSAYQSAAGWSQFVNIIEEVVVYADEKVIPDVVAGGFRDKIVELGLQLNRIERLKIQGVIDARDFRVIRDSIPLLKEIDLSAATIAAIASTSEGTILPLTTTSYSENQIPHSGFKRMLRLSKVVLPPSVTAISTRAFEGCRQISTIDFPQGLLLIGGAAFSEAGIVDLVFPASVVTIADYAFSNCINLRTMDIKQPNNIVYGPYAFNGCYNLTYINIADATPPTLSSSSFNAIRYNSCTLVVPTGASTAYKAATNWKSFINIVEGTSAYSASNTAGGLRTLDPSILRTVQKLSLTGTVNAVDFRIMRDSMPFLEELDLTGASVVAYTGTEGTVSLKTEAYAANTIPQMAMINKSLLHKVQLPVTVLAIDSSAFASCQALDTINLDAINSIADRAFMSCAKLDGIVSSAVISVGESAFQHCIALSSFNFAAVTSLGQAAFSGCTSLSTLSLPSLINLDASIFENCSGLNGELNIPVSVTNISAYAFANCTGLTGTSSLSGVSHIALTAFQGCKFMVASSDYWIDSDSVIYSSSARTRLLLYPVSKQGAFVIPASVSSIAPAAFSNCTGLTAVSTSGTLLTAVPDSCFLGCSSLKSVDFSKSQLLEVGRAAFKDNYNLLSLKLPGTLKYIRSAAFEQCLNLNEFNLPAAVLEIGDRAFYGCNKIAVFSLNEGLQSIGNSAFARVNFRDLKIPASVQTIASMAFYRAVFTRITLNASTPVDLSNSPTVFNCNKQTVPLFVPAGSATAYKQADQWADFSNIMEPKSLNITGLTAGGLKNLVSDYDQISATSLSLSGSMDATDFNFIRQNMFNLENINLDGISLISYYKGNEGSYIVANFEYNQNVVAAGGFMGLTKLKTVVLPACADSIGIETFSGCTALTAVSLGTGVQSIGTKAFITCVSLTVISLPSSVKYIAPSVFYNCFNLSDISLPAGLDSIGSDAFLGCRKLTKIEIPETVKMIGKRAFMGCHSLAIVDFKPASCVVADYAFANVVNLTTLYARAATPVALSNVYVFSGVDKSACTLYVPGGSESLYQAANQWKDFLLLAPAPTTKQLTLKVLLEGLWNGTSMNKCKKWDDGLGDFADAFSSDIVDTISVELRSATYSNIAYRITGLELDQDGTVHTPGNSYVEIPGEVGGDYYITIRTRNHLETTTAALVSFGASTVDYDFTDAVAKAFVSDPSFTPMVQKNGLWMLYAGNPLPTSEVNTDYIESIDLFEVVNNQSDISGLYGYLNIDINGDGLIDATDIFQYSLPNFNVGIYFYFPE